MQSSLRSGAWICLAGAGIGWMIGLSNSPVLGSVLTPILATILAALAAISSLQTEAAWAPKIRSFSPIALFVLSCAVAATAGVIVRHNSFLSTPENQSVMAPGLFSSSVEDSQCAELIQASFENAPSVLEGARFDDVRIKHLLEISLTDEVKFRQTLGILCGN